MIERLEYGKYCQINGGPILEGAEYRELGKSIGFPHSKDLDAWAPWYIQPGQEPKKQKEHGLSAYFPITVTHEAEDVSKQSTKIYHTLQRVRFVGEQITNRSYRIARVLSAESSHVQTPMSSPLVLFRAHQEELQGLTKTASNNLKPIDPSLLLKAYNTEKKRPTLGHFKIVNDIMNGLPVSLLSPKGEPLEEATFYQQCDIIKELLPPCVQKYFSALWNGDKAELRSSPFKLTEVVHSSQLVMFSSPCAIDHKARNYELSDHIIRISTKYNLSTDLNPQYPFTLYDQKGEQNNKFSFLFKEASSQEIPDVMEFALEAINSKEANLVKKITNPKAIVYRLPKVKEASQHLSSIDIVNELSGWSSFEYVKAELLKYLNGEEVDLETVLLSLESQHLRLILLLHLYDEFTDHSSKHQDLDDASDKSQFNMSEIELNFFNIYCALEIEVLNPANPLTQEYLEQHNTLKTFDTLQSLLSIKKADSMSSSISIFTEMLGQLLKRWQISPNQEKRGLEEYISIWTRLLDLYLLYLRSLKGKKHKKADVLWTLILQHHQHPFLKDWVRLNIVDICLNVFSFRLIGQVFQSAPSNLERMACQIAINFYMEEIYQFRHDDVQKKRHRLLDFFMICTIEQGITPNISHSLEYIENVDLLHNTKLIRALSDSTEVNVVDELALIDWILERYYYYPCLALEHLKRVNQVINNNIDLLIDRWLEEKSQQGLKLIFSSLDINLVNLFSISPPTKSSTEGSDTTKIQKARFEKVSNLSHFNIGYKRWSKLMRSLIEQINQERKTSTLDEKRIKVEALFNLLCKDDKIDKTNGFIRSLLSYYFTKNGHNISILDEASSGEELNKDSYILCQPFAEDQNEVSGDKNILKRDDIQRYDKDNDVFLGLNALEIFQLITWPFDDYKVKEKNLENHAEIIGLTRLVDRLIAKFHTVITVAKEKKVDSRNFGFLYTSTWILGLLRLKFGNRSSTDDATDADRKAQLANQRVNRLYEAQEAGSAARTERIDHIISTWPVGKNLNSKEASRYIRSLLTQSKLLHLNFAHDHRRHFEQDRNLYTLLLNKNKKTNDNELVSNIMFTSEFVQHKLLQNDQVKDPQELFSILVAKDAKIQQEIIDEIKKDSGKFYDVLIKNLRQTGGVHQVQFGWTKTWLKLNWFVPVQPLLFNFHIDLSKGKQAVKRPNITIEDEMNHFERPRQIYQSDEFKHINGTNVLYIRQKFKGIKGIKGILEKLQTMLKELNYSTSVSARISQKTSPEKLKPVTSDES